ncbi:hypothetical protein O181_042434 [Austropuccinia psidii MF-1]|uniref:Uncharacterized protein n=1 Tax=Austropuccinia psidii MF-1 TaxID=1389203 RepID=A0A9Q3HHG8_9BASI|nr:hypothetical protein [Austropuccinia psidii MF-1]
MILGYTRCKKPLIIPNLILTKIELYHGFVTKRQINSIISLHVRIYDSQKILRQCGGDLEHSVKTRTTEQSSEEDIINILEEVTTRARISSSRVNLKTRLDMPLKDSADKNPKENSNHMKYKSEDIIRKCHIFQNNTHLANSCPRKGKINEIEIEKKPDIKEDNELIEENSHDK